ncbi:MAG: glycosyltransferase [Bacteroidetes bacterium]|nr:glycosyltransferase [Bacteroidota bacterium]
MAKDVNPLISVLMPVYNGQQYLAEAIESILKQTYKHFELLILDDGSSDNSESIIKGFEDSRIVYIKNETNKGLIFTLNRGIGLSKGTFIARMDADDVSVSTRFEKQILEFEKDENLVICGSFIKTFGNGSEEYISHIPVTNAQILSSIFFVCPFAHPSVMIKKESLLQLNEFYREDYKHSEDYDLWSRLVFLGNSKNIPEFLLNYRIHDKQVSTVFEDHKYQSVSKIQTNLLSQFNIFPTAIESKFLLNLFKGISKQDEDYLNSGVAFLDKLHRQFAIKYPNYLEEHSRVLVSRWVKVCGNSGMGLLNIKLAFKLPFFKVKYLKFKDFIKLFYKTITKYSQLDKK